MYFKLLLLALLFTFSGCEDKSSITEEDISTPQKAVNQNLFQLKDINGKVHEAKKTKEGIQVEGFEGKVVLLDFWATWCPPCRAEIPHLANLQKKYHDQFAVLALLMEEDKKNSDLQEFKDEFGINYTIFNGPENYRLSDALGGIKSLPTMIIYDPKGKYFNHYLGAIPEEMIEKDIQRALGQ